MLENWIRLFFRGGTGPSFIVLSSQYYIYGEVGKKEKSIRRNSVSAIKTIDQMLSWLVGD